MNATISTCNMAEALYLLRRGNRVVSVCMACTWPYGLEECAMVFEGECAEADHDRYIANCPCVDLGCLPELFAAVTAVLPAEGRPRMKTVIFSNQKGGVGKTTLTRELGIYLSSLAHRVLLVDCDPQGNLTKSLLDGTDCGLYDALTSHGLPPLKLDETLSLFAGDFRLALLEKSLIGEIDAYSRLRALLSDSALTKFDYIFLDTPPSLGVLTVNALAAAQYLVIPMNPSLYSMQGTNDLMRTVSKVRANLNPTLSLLGVIINAYDSVPVITRQIREEIERSFGAKVFATVLSKSIRIEEAIAARQGVIHHKHLGASRAREEVQALGDELLRRLEACTTPEVGHGN